MPIDVTHFGIHTSMHGISFLEQQRTPRDHTWKREATSTNALGQKLISPFRVRPTGRIRECGHDIRINEAAPSREQWTTFCKMVDEDELLRAVCPVPRSPAWLVFAPQWTNAFETMIELSKMTSPLKIPVKSFLTMTAREILAECEITNVQPLVLLDAHEIYGEKMEHVAAGHRGMPRNLVILGKCNMVPPPGFRIIETTLNTKPLAEIMALPWERIGGTVVRKVMRGEWKL